MTTNETTPATPATEDPEINITADSIGDALDDIFKSAGIDGITDKDPEWEQLRKGIHEAIQAQDVQALSAAALTAAKAKAARIAGTRTTGELWSAAYDDLVSPHPRADAAKQEPRTATQLFEQGYAKSTRRRAEGK